MIEIVDTSEHVARLTPILDEMVREGLVTMEKVQVLKHAAGTRRRPDRRYDVPCTPCYSGGHGAQSVLRRLQADPYLTYGWLRDHAPVYLQRRSSVWALSRWDDVLAASLAHDVYSSAKGTVLELDASSSFPIIIFMDPPRQTPAAARQQGVHAGAHRRARAVHPPHGVELDRMGDAGRSDFIADFAARLPIADDQRDDRCS